MNRLTQKSLESFSRYYATITIMSIFLFFAGVLSLSRESFFTTTPVYNIVNLYGTTLSLIALIYLLAINGIQSTLAMACIFLNTCSLLLVDLDLFNFANLFASNPKNADLVDFTLISFLSTAYVGNAYFVLLHLANIKDRKSLQLAAFTGLPILGLLAVAFLTTSFASISSYGRLSTYLREATVAVFPLFLAAATALFNDLKLGHTNPLPALKARYDLIKNSSDSLVYIGIFLLCASASFMMSLSIPQKGELGSLLWIATMLVCHRHFSNYRSNYNNLSLEAIVANQSATNFLKRHFQNSHNWAATTGIKTASFIIDHATDKYADQIPSTIQQIRRQIIKDSTTKVLGNHYLQMETWNDRIIGSIDPEPSVKPCVDTIILFTCLYMDGIPLLERRIKTLSSILPIVDSGADKVINERVINSVLSRNEWLFYLDYNWVDQHLIHTNGRANYHYEARSMNEEEKYVVTSELRRRSLLGNYIWVSDAARRQIESESSHLSKVIIPVELNLPGRPGQIIFLMKFEDIIPRLQRYYLLDYRRDVLQDIPQSKDSKRLCNLIELQLSQEFDINKAKEIVDSIRAFPWQGYRAKDAALNLLLNLHDKTMSYIGRLLIDENLKMAQKEEFKKLFITTVNEIGYPSQYLHNAQLDKLAYRDSHTLLEIAQKPTHKKFSDVWLHLASNEATGNEKDLLDLVHFLKTIPLKNWGQYLPFVRVKATGVLNQFPRRFIIKHKSKIEECLNLYYKWILSNLKMDDLFWLLDVHLHLMTMTKNEIRLDAELIQQLKQIETYTTEPGSVEEMMKLAYSSRLQKVINFDENTKNAAPIAYYSDSA